MTTNQSIHSVMALSMVIGAAAAAVAADAPPAMVGYQVNRHLHCQLNLANLTDRQNYASDGGFLRPSPPLSITGTIGWKF